MKKTNREVKIDVTKIDIIRRLRDKNAILIGGSKEVTTRYDTIDRSLEKQGKFIRTMEGFRNTVTLKEKVTENTSLFERDEFSVEIDDVENIQEIFERIGLMPILKMEKYRLKWDLDGVKLNLDELPFGLYLEIHGNEKNVENIMSKLDLLGEERIIQTYWDIYNKYKKENNITDSDITFSKDYNYKLM